jgi:hypothetical protein
VSDGVFTSALSRLFTSSVFRTGEGRFGWHHAALAIDTRLAIAITDKSGLVELVDQVGAAHDGSPCSALSTLYS